MINTQPPKYLVAVDLDGTLLKDNKKISFYSRHFLKKFERDGNIVIISTGRPPRSGLKYYEMLDLHTPALFSNGSICYNPSDPNFKGFSHIIKKEDLINIVSYLTKNKLIDGAYTENLDTIYYTAKDYFNFTIQDKNITNEKYGDFKDILDKDSYGLVMHYIDKSPANRERIQKYMNKNYKNLYIDFWNSNSYCDVQVKDINKATSLRKIMKIYNIKEENVMTFGDGSNDFDLITSFPHGFAMINSNEKLSSKAKNVTKKDNNHNGVVYEIKKFLKSKDL